MSYNERWICLCLAITDPSLATAVAWPVYIRSRSEARVWEQQMLLGTDFAMTDAGDELLTLAQPVYVQHVCLCYCLWFPEGCPGWLAADVGMCGSVWVFVEAGERWEEQQDL